MQAILDAPEFILAAVFAMLWAGVKRSDTTASIFPTIYRDMSAQMVRALPGASGYTAWLARTQMWSAWHKNSGFGELCALKLTLSLAVLCISLFLSIYFVLPLSLAAFFLPDAFIYIRMRHRQQQIVESLPQALDLMILCIDAGLGLDATIQRIAKDQSTLSSALNEELQTLCRDILLGMQRDKAYLELYSRTGVEELKTFASALNQSAKLGLSIGRILRAQALFMRTRQQQRAEERAAKVPIWMAFPLWFCIMPALMLLLVGPSILQLFQQVNHFPAEWFH
jgi:tight adherence protein C